MKLEKVYIVIGQPPARPDSTERYSLPEIEEYLVAELHAVRDDVLKSLRGTEQPASSDRLLPVELLEHPVKQIMESLKHDYHDATAHVLSSFGEERRMWESIRLDMIQFLMKYAGPWFATPEFFAWLRQP